MSGKFGLQFHGPNPKDFDRAMETGADWYGILDSDAWWYIPRIYQRQPDAKVILRMVGISPTRDIPFAVAERARSLYDDYRPAALQIGNEWNLGAEHGDEDSAFWSTTAGYNRQLGWWQKFLVAWNNHADVLVGPNLSPDFELERGLQILKPVIKQFRYLGIHVYGQLTIPGYIAVNFPNKEIIVTEFNTQWVDGDDHDKRRAALAVSDFYQIWYPAFKAIIYYQWDGNRDGAVSGKNFNMADNYELWTMVKTMNKTPQPQLQLQPVSPYTTSTVSLPKPKPIFDKDAFWDDYMGKIYQFPALAKYWSEHIAEVGWPLDGFEFDQISGIFYPQEYRIAGYTFLRCTKAILQWLGGIDVRVIRTKNDLP